MTQYKIRFGESFKQPDGTTLAGGDTIELDDEMASIHRAKIEPLPVTSADQAETPAAE